MVAPDPEFVVDFPTLGFLIHDWIAQHCIIPDGFHKGRPYVMADWQLWCTCKHYQVKPEAHWDPEQPRVSTNFVYRRSQIIAPQKTGKGPWAAAIITAEGLGPSVFVGWAVAGDVYACEDFGCDCGWVYEYEAGEPMGMPRPSPLIQLTATSRDQTRNVYNPLKVMFRRGGLEVAEARTGEEFIRLPDDGRIDTVTSSATARLGNPVTFVLHDESGIYTKSNGMVSVAETQLRGLAGMDARGIETTNPWDPTENSTGQATFEAPVDDIFRFYREPPKHLKYTREDDRRRIHKFVYEGSWWVNLDAIEGLAAELLAKGETAQAERFYGNRIVRGASVWLEDGVWENADARARSIPDGTLVCAGFDGSDVDDWTALRLETIDGHRFTPTYGPDQRPAIWDPAEWGGSIPRTEVDSAVDEIFRRYGVVRMYCDPRDWKSEIGEWSLEHGEKSVIEWATNRVVQMHSALNRYVTDLKSGRSTHDGCKTTTVHVGNARKAARPGDRYILTKASAKQKIDAAMADVLAHEAAQDAHASGDFDRMAKARSRSKKMVVL